MSERDTLPGKSDEKRDQPLSKDERLDEGLEETFPASDPPAPVREQETPQKD